LALQIESSITHSYDKDGKTKHAPKENNQDPNNHKQHTKPPMCNDCCGAKATRKPWRGKGERYRQSHLKKTPHPGEVVSVDQLESSIPGFIGQMTGKLEN